MGTHCWHGRHRRNSPRLRQEVCAAYGVMFCGQRERSSQDPWLPVQEPYRDPYRGHALRAEPEVRFRERHRTDPGHGLAQRRVCRGRHPPDHYGRGRSEGLSRVVLPVFAHYWAEREVRTGLGNLKCLLESGTRPTATTRRPSLLSGGPGPFGVGLCSLAGFLLGCSTQEPGPKRRRG